MTMEMKLAKKGQREKGQTNLVDDEAVVWVALLGEVEDDLLDGAGLVEEVVDLALVAAGMDPRHVHRPLLPVDQVEVHRPL